jgi:hypothetical protein
VAAVDSSPGTIGFCIEFRPHDAPAATALAAAPRLLPAARAFEAEFVRLVRLGERGTLVLLYDRGVTRSLVAARTVAPGRAG